MMVGAGIVALIQVAFIILRRGPIRADASSATRSVIEVRRSLGLGSAIYVLIAAVIAVLGGLVAQLSIGMLIAFLVYAAFAALVHELIVGLAAMHSGWFPAFAVALITLVIGMLIGFPPVALALLVGFSAATGPAFADMGYDLKAGFMLSARLRQRSRIRARRPAPAVVRCDVRLRHRRHCGADRLSWPVRSEPRGAGGSRLCRDDQGGRVGRRGVVADNVGNPWSDHPVPGWPAPSARHPAGNRLADPLSTRRVGPCLPAWSAAPCGSGPRTPRAWRCSAPASSRVTRCSRSSPPPGRRPSDKARLLRPCWSYQRSLALTPLPSWSAMFRLVATARND